MLKRRIVVLVLVFTMGLALLNGCGTNDAKTGGDDKDANSEMDNGGGQSSETGENNVQDTDPFGKYEDEITITIARVEDSGLKYDPSKEGYKSLEDNVWITAYKEKLGINIEYIWTTTDDTYVAKWNTSIAGSDIPDFAIVPGSVYQQLLEADMVEDMTDYFETYASDLYKEAAAKDDGLAASYITVDGRMMGLPHTGGTPDNSNLLYIRKDWLDKVNMEAPKTVEELVATARAFKEAKLGGEDTVGLAICNAFIAGQCDIGGFLNGFGVYPNIWVESEDGNLVYGNVQPEMKDALKVLQDMYKEGLIQQDFAVQDGGTATELVASGKCGIMYGTFWASLGGMMTSITDDPDSDWIVLDGVTADGSPYMTQGSAAPTNYIFVKKGIEHPEAAVKLINLKFKLDDEEPEIYSRTYFGEDGDVDNSIESIYYSVAPYVSMPWKNMDVTKQIWYAMETGDTSELEGTSLLNDYYSYSEIQKGTNETKGNVPSYLVSGPDNSAYARINEMMESGRIYTDKFTAIPSDFMQQNLTDLNEQLLAQYLKIIMGDDIATFDQAVDTWYSNGGDKITEEVNEWYKTAK